MRYRAYWQGALGFMPIYRMVGMQDDKLAKVGNPYAGIIIPHHDGKRIIDPGQKASLYRGQYYRYLLLDAPTVIRHHTFAQIVLQPGVYVLVPAIAVQCVIRARTCRTKPPEV